MRPIVIAIDGPSGVGKGTIARAVAAALGYRHVDTGAMYRAVAWRALQLGVALDDEGAVGGVARSAEIDASDRVVMVDGQDVTASIRTPEIDRGAARVARIPGVRAALVQRQRQLGRGGAVVVEGRDIGTAVFPGAEVKIYLDASPEERARRRVHDPCHNGCHDMATVRSELAARDESDRTRPVSPLAAAADAHVLDTTGLSIGAVVDCVLEIVRKTVDG